MPSRVLGGSRRRGPHGLRRAHVVSISVSLINWILFTHIFAAAAPRRRIGAVMGPAAAASFIPPPVTFILPARAQS